MIPGTSRIDWKVRYGDAEASHTISLTLPPLESYHGNNVLFEFEWPAAALPQDIQVALGGVELGDAKIRSDIVQDRATRFQLRVSLLREVAGALYGEKNLPQ
jgi:hypothetical protein